MERLERLAYLAAEVRNGHPERAEELLREGSGIAHAVARARLGDTLAAEEAAADALARAARSISGLRDPRAFPRWLARIAARTAADAVRRKTDSVSAEMADLADPGAGPAEAVRSNERAAAVRAAVRLLRPKLRAPLLLHFTEGLTYREVAATLGASLSTVARRMEKALAALKRALPEEP